MRQRLLRLCAVFAMTVGLVPAMSATAVADTGADLSVTATWVGKGVPRASLGDRVTYAITVTNLGPDTATGTYLSEGTPDQFNPVSLTCSDASFCASPGGELAPGATVTATVVEVVCCFQKGESNRPSPGADVVSSTPDPHYENNSGRVLTKLVGPHGVCSSPECKGEL
jgi:uncharacterized repeat protein (TIGR01451 family)